MSPQTLYILYNADASIMGKLSYGYRKITAGSKDGCEPECAACDITHGGLSLKETPGWVEAKNEIEASSTGLKVVQWHRDEISPQLQDYVQKQELRYPTVVLEQSEGDFKPVMDRSELATLKGDAQSFVKELRSKGVLQ